MVFGMNQEPETRPKAFYLYRFFPEGLEASEGTGYPPTRTSSKEVSTVQESYWSPPTVPLLVEVHFFTTSERQEVESGRKDPPLVRGEKPTLQRRQTKLTEGL